MPLKPSILKGIENILGSKKIENFVNDAEDYLILEDTSGRIRISNSSPLPGFSPSYFISGIVAALKGRLDDRGLFLMEDVCYLKSNDYSIPKLIQNKIKIDDSLDNSAAVFNMLNSNNPIITFVSGLKFGDQDFSGKTTLARNLLLDFFQGNLIYNEMVNRLIKRINRVIIAGNSIFSPDEIDLTERGSYVKQEINKRVYKALLQNFEELDKFLNILSHSVRVDLMPGADDNSSSFFPQIGINSILLPLSSKNNTLNLVTNPYKFQLGDLKFLGTSGQNIDNIKKYSRISSSAVDLLEKTLDWGHLSPSAPDTLRTYPFKSKDPLILKDIPNVYFTSNQKKFETKLTLYNSIPLRLISIPDFTKTFSIVLFDSLTLEACQLNLEFF